MANTGRKIVLTLKQQYVALPHNPTGLTKPNAVGDPDYLAPYTSTDCAVANTTACPVVLATGSAGAAFYEFSLLSSVLTNPAIAKVKIKIMNGATVVASQVVNFPHPLNYFSGSIVVVAGTYSLDIDYLDSSNAVVASCPNLVASIIVT